MSHEGSALDLNFHVFDHIEHQHTSYVMRHSLLKCSINANDSVVLLPQHYIFDRKALEVMEQDTLKAGYEGLILRDPQAPYKQGRSTTREQIMLKLKRFKDAEFMVAGFEERMENTNVKTINELGYSHRSSHQDLKFGRGDLGALILHHPNGTFNVGTGFSDDERIEIWDNRGKYISKMAKIKFFDIGTKDFPRHPVFLGWRLE
jgi:DNA ligase-1